MRNVMKRRRRLGEVNPYAAILATNPDFFVGLEYAKIGSQQVLWQDDAGTATPVTAIGDPIGCVRHPVTGAIMMSQSVLASRPVWAGPGVGASFDGMDDHLINGTLATITGTRTVLAWAEPSGTGNRTVITQRMSAAAVGWAHRLNTTNLVTFHTGVSASVTTTSTITSDPIFTGWVFNSSSGHEHFIDGTAGTSNASTTGAEDGPNGIWIGAEVAAGGLPANLFRGNIAAAAVYSRAMSGAEIISLA
jgi:hypothetical protein